jgi:hypothetical protein
VRTSFLLVAVSLCATAAACITPSVVGSSGRAVAPASQESQWVPAQAFDLDGLWESVATEGARSPRCGRVCDVFSADGSYTGVALVLGGANPEFQTLSGRWKHQEAKLDLGDGQTVRADVPDEHLRLSSAGDVAILRRAAIQ